VGIILFEHPRIPSATHYNDVANAPLHACLMTGSLAAVLQHNGFDVTIYDAYLAGEGFDDAYERLSTASGNLLGVHAVYFWEQTPELFAFLHRLKRARPDCALVLYGIFPTAHWEHLLVRYPWIDAIVLGEPEETFLAVARTICAGKSLAAECIPGVAVRRGDASPRATHRQLIEHLDRLPFPVRHQALLHTIGCSVLGSRGCSGSCSFCCINPFYGTRAHWRGRTPENIDAELQTLLLQVPERYLYFLDANFFGSGAEGKKRASRIAEIIAAYHVHFGLEARPCDLDKTTVAKLAAAGLRDVFLGIESGSDASLRRMRKRGCRQDSSAALSLLRAYGITVTPGFIMFEPEATLEAVCENIAFLQREHLVEYLPITANVLYHREISLAAMPNFRSSATAGRFVAYDDLGYEGYYEFADLRVAVLADVMSVVCRAVLKMMDEPTSPLWRHGGSSSTAAQVNQYLVDYFNECLGRLLIGDISCDARARAYLQDRALQEIVRLCTAGTFSDANR